MFRNSKAGTRAGAALVLALGVAVFGGAAASYAAEASDPVPPTFIDACGRDGDMFVVPEAEGVRYMHRGLSVNQGVRAVSPENPTVQIFAVAAPGFELSAPASWQHTFDTERGCDTGSPVIFEGEEEQIPEPEPEPEPTEPAEPEPAEPPVEEDDSDDEPDKVIAEIGEEPTEDEETDAEDKGAKETGKLPDTGAETLPLLALGAALTGGGASLKAANRNRYVGKHRA